MKKYNLSVFILVIFCSLFPALLYSQVDTAWVRRYNGSGNDYDYALAIVVDGQRNVYVTGYSVGSGTSDDYATIKYNSAGVQQWVQRYNGPGNSDDNGVAIVVDGSGNVYVTGYSYGSGTSYDYATIKYNSAGVQQWVQRYDGSGNAEDRACSIAVDGSGNVYVTGYSGLYPNYDYATIKYNSNGDTLWVRRYNGPGNGSDYPGSLAVDDSGNVYVTGSSGLYPNYDYATIKYNSNGDTLWVRRYNGPGNGEDDAYAMAVDGQGNVYVTGASYGSGIGYMTIKYNSNGDTLWVRTHNRPGCAYAIAVDESGNVYVTGECYDSGTFWDYATIKYNSAGVQQWIQTYNGPGNGYDEACSISVDGQGNVYVTGWIAGLTTSDDYATIKYNSAGAEQWVQTYNGPGNGWDRAHSIAVDSAGNVYVTGASIGSGTNVDYATIKYVQTGAIEENRLPLSVDRFSLEIYPNPMKTLTDIRYSLPAESKVSLQLYDISGRLVKTLVNEQKKQGDYSTPINTQALSAGVYFLSLQTTSKRLIERLVIVK